MKRYLLFCFENYEPSGGWGDFIGSYSTLTTAKSARTRLLGNKNDMRFGGQVVDGKTGLIVLEFESERLSCEEKERIKKAVKKLVPLSNKK